MSSSYDNLIKLLRGSKSDWIPFYPAETKTFNPRIHPDYIARQRVNDGMPISYAEGPKKDMLGIEWIYEHEANGAIERPDRVLLEDLNEWESFVSFPDLDSWDWEREAQQTSEYRSGDQLLVNIMYCGLWERLISLMGVANAAVALIDEDQTNAVHHFFDKLCTFYDSYIARLQKYFGIQLIKLHDDWGTQRAPFFSKDVFDEMILPYLKRIVQSCHSRGIYYEQHCCGKADLLLPSMIDAGVDIWCGQDINDFDALLERYGSSIVMKGDISNISPNASEDELEKAAESFIRKHKNHRVVLCSFDPAAERLRPYICLKT